MIPGLQHKSFTSFDGTRIAYQVRGPEAAPVVVLSNGLGGTYEAFRHIYAALGERYRILCWDYRGLYRSARPKDLATLAIREHCRDLALLLETEGAARALFIGWSMGVQVNFEFFRQHRTKMKGMIAVNGTYGLPFRTAMASRLTRYVIPPILSLMEAQAKLVSKVSHHAVAWDGLVPLIVRAGLAAPTIDVEAMKDVAGDFRTLDFAVYAQQMKRLGEHDAKDLLPAIDIPVLIITGDQDLMTPVFTARTMNRLIRGSRLLILRGGSHYTPIEFGQEIGDEVRRFVSQVPGFQTAEAS